MRWVKSGTDKRVQNEFVYNSDGTIKTRISYKDFSKNLVSAKEELVYNNGRLQSVTTQIDLSSSLSAVHYDYSKTEYDYNQAGLPIQRNFFSKEGDDYKLRSFTVYEYNSTGLPIRETRFDKDGVSYAYNIYTYNTSGNVIAKDEYNINRSSGTPELLLKSTFKHDAYNNPYKKAYNITELIPFSVNNNNIIEQTSTNYGLGGLGIPVASKTVYSTHNSRRYPLAMDENGNLFSFEYY